MCHRFQPFLTAELQAALDEQRTTGRARMPRRADDVTVPDAYPGRAVPLFVPSGSNAASASSMPDAPGTIDTASLAASLEVATLTWGFSTSVGGAQKLVFNTRIETALSQAASGRGLWARAITQGRCLVPVRGFFESWTKSPERRRGDVRFCLPGHRVFLLAGIWQDERFSVMTTRPNADVATYHTRMPLVLGPGESSVWLGPDYASLVDRSGLRLEASPEL